MTEVFGLHLHAGTSCACDLTSSSSRAANASTDRGKRLPYSDHHTLTDPESAALHRTSAQGGGTRFCELHADSKVKPERILSIGTI